MANHFSLRRLFFPIALFVVVILTTNLTITSYNVKGVRDTSWSKSTITYSNTLTVGSTINSSKTVNADSWSEIDVFSYITGKRFVSLIFITTVQSVPYVAYYSLTYDSMNDALLFVTEGETWQYD